jgi:betaine-aldehyde dehydrogenase/5-carboxymethyl-2-hydroxymuconic-semialdehyde dehydrogenase
MRERITIEGVSVSPDHFINGKRVSSATTFETRCPFDWNIKLADISRGDGETAALAAQAASAAFPIWAGMSTAERGAIMHRLSDLIEANQEQLAIVECMDMAMLHESLRLRVIARAALNFRSYADLANDHVERVWSSKGTANRVIRMPAGPAVIITPWNAPFMLSTWKLRATRSFSNLQSGRRSRLPCSAISSTKPDSLRGSSISSKGWAARSVMRW